MTYEEARRYLQEKACPGTVLGLTRLKELLRRLGNPEKDLTFIHVVGTNGKGSVVAFISEILQEASYRVGKYVSPTLFSYRERLQINGELITPVDFAAAMSEVAAAAENMRTETGVVPTVFEMETAAGFIYFAAKHCDYVVLEAGMGGRFDATNVIPPPLLCVFTKISEDHLGMIGNNLSEIAKTKAGILKQGSRAVSGRQEESVKAILTQEGSAQLVPMRFADERMAKNISRDFTGQIFDYGPRKDLKITLLAPYQIYNATLAIEAVLCLRELGVKISETELYAGLVKARWDGRFTILRQLPCCLIDGAHNKDGALALKKALQTYFPERNIHYVIGIFKDKAYEDILRILLQDAASVTTVELPDPKRTLSAELLRDAASRYCARTFCIKDVKEAVNYTIKRVPPQDVVCICGSLSHLKAAKEEITGEKTQD